jgi:hypothetical protein
MVVHRFSPSECRSGSFPAGFRILGQQSQQFVDAPCGGRAVRDMTPNNSLTRLAAGERFGT